jgi:hypothetical protein
LTIELLFVCAVSNVDVLKRRLLTSPCLQPGQRPLALRWNARSAADALNPILESTASALWVVWVHQDVVLPQGWDARFLDSARQFEKGYSSSNADFVRRDPVGVLGVYGVRGHGSAAQRVGRVLDRGRWLDETATLPGEVDSLDELLLALPGDTDLRLDPALGFDLYGTDIVLQAQTRGQTAWVVDAPCEHWSDTPRAGRMPASLIERVAASGDAFERKWAARLPLKTPCFNIDRPGDVRRFAASLSAPAARQP